MFSRIGISSSLAGPRLTKLVQQTCADATNDNSSGLETVESSDVEATGESQVVNSIGALMAGAAAKRREREMLFTNVGPCRRALCARTDLAMRKRLRRLTGKVGSAAQLTRMALSIIHTWPNTSCQLNALQNLLETETCSRNNNNNYNNNNNNNSNIHSCMAHFHSSMHLTK